LHLLAEPGGCGSSPLRVVNLRTRPGHAAGRSPFKGAGGYGFEPLPGLPGRFRNGL